MLGARESIDSSVDMKSSHQRAGFLFKLPMSKPASEKWQKRQFVAKDGFLLYYGANAPANPTNFDTKPKVIEAERACGPNTLGRGGTGASPFRSSYGDAGGTLTAWRDGPKIF